MFFETMKDARAYAKSLTADCRGIAHIVIACKQWRFDRARGEYAQYDCFTVKMKGA